MPISEKIISEIEKLNVAEEFQSLMKEILSLEDDGVKRWKVQYESKLKAYLEENGKEEMGI